MADGSIFTPLATNYVIFTSKNDSRIIFYVIILNANIQENVLFFARTLSGAGMGHS